MAIARVNKLGSATSTSTGLSSLTMTVTATTTIHNRIIVAAVWGANNPTATVTDSQGNSYTQDAVGAVTGGTATYGRVFSARADLPLTSGVDTIRITWSGSTANIPMMAAYEYSGIANFLPQDQLASATATSSNPSSGSATTVFANELVFGLLGWNSNSNTSATAYTELDHLTTTNRSLETQEHLVSATGTYAVTATVLGTAPTWFALLVSYSDTANPANGVPANTTLPTITGSGVVGMQLTCSQGFWSNTPTAYSYQWKRDGSNIATGAHYRVVAADVGHALSCVVSASNKYGPTAATASNTVTPSVNKVQPGLGI